MKRKERESKWKREDKGHLKLPRRGRLKSTVLGKIFKHRSRSKIRRPRKEHQSNHHLFLAWHPEKDKNQSQRNKYTQNSMKNLMDFLKNRNLSAKKKTCQRRNHNLNKTQKGVTKKRRRRRKRRKNRRKKRRRKRRKNININITRKMSWTS